MIEQNNNDSNNNEQFPNIINDGNNFDNNINDNNNNNPNNNINNINNNQINFDEQNNIPKHLQKIKIKYFKIKCRFKLEPTQITMKTYHYVSETEKNL